MSHTETFAETLTATSLPGDLLDCKPVEVIDVALCRLQDIGVELIEWRVLVFARMDVPVMFRDFSYLVPDGRVAEVSTALTELGLPFSPPTKLNTDVYGDFDTKGCFHRITRENRIIQYIAIYPRSFADLADSELEKKTPFHKPFPRSAPILVPTPPAVYASIMRMMLRYTKAHPTRAELLSNLSELVGYHLYRLEGGYLQDCETDEEWEAMGMDQKISDAVHLVQSWGEEGLWRAGEEWMGDAQCLHLFNLCN